MKKAFRYILCAVFLALILAIVGVSYYKSGMTRRELVCTGINIEVLDSSKVSFIRSEDIVYAIGKEYGVCKGKKLDSLDLVKIEKIVNSKSAVLKSEAYVTSDGLLNVDIRQRYPAIRFQRKDGGFYADKDGRVFPLQRNYTAHVPIIEGDIPLPANSGYNWESVTPEQRTWILKMLELVEYLDSSIWGGNIVQISVRSGGDLVLIPREGKEKIIFGQPYGIKEKFGRLEKYYTCIRPAKEEGYYSSVNVKYRNQIICRR